MPSQPYIGRHRAKRARTLLSAPWAKPLAWSAVGLTTTTALVQSAVAAPSSQAAAAAPAAEVMVAGPPPQATSAMAKTLSISSGVATVLSRHATASTRAAGAAAAYSGTTLAQAGAGAMVTNVRLTSHFGQRWGRLHAGLDFAGPVGTPIRAVRPGKVTFAGGQQGYGNKVELTLADGTVLYFAHLNSIAVTEGQQVSAGQVIATLGNTGNSTGPHLHFEVHPGGGGPIDPAGWLHSNGLWPLGKGAKPA